MSDKDAKPPARKPGASVVPRGGPRKKPVRFTAALAQEICERIAAGERWTNMANTARMPAHAMPYLWAKKFPAFGEAFALARRVGADARADRVLDVAETATAETLSQDRMQIGALKWHVDRDDKRFTGRDEPDLGAGRRLIIEVRRFERYTAADGSTQVREILPAPRRRDAP